MDSAETALKEARQLTRQLTNTDAERFGFMYGYTLEELGDLYRLGGRMAEAEQAYSESVRVLQSRAQAHPDFYQPFVAQAFERLARVYCGTTRLKECEAAFDQAMQILNSLPAPDQESHAALLGSVVTGLSSVYAQTNRASLAAPLDDQSVAIFRSLVKRDARFRLQLATAITNSALAHANANQLARARSEIDEASALQRALQDEASSQLDPDAAAHTLLVSARIAILEKQPAASICGTLADAAAVATAAELKSTAEEAWSTGPCARISSQQRQPQ